MQFHFMVGFLFLTAVSFGQRLMWLHGVFAGQVPSRETFQRLEDNY